MMDIDDDEVMTVSAEQVQQNIQENKMDSTDDTQM